MYCCVLATTILTPTINEVPLVCQVRSNAFQNILVVVEGFEPPSIRASAFSAYLAIITGCPSAKLNYTTISWWVAIESNDACAPEEYRASQLTPTTRKHPAITTVGLTITRDNRVCQPIGDASGCLVDRGRIELPSPACKAGVIPSIRTAH